MSREPEETKEVGFRLGRLLKPGDIVCLYGELGAGKTTMVKGIARAIGIDERQIISVSFTIVTEYQSRPPLVHIDLYRIDSDAEIPELGLWDYVRDDTISVIEWPEKVERELPDGVIRVTIRPVDENTREITIEEKDEKDRDNL
ncbi:MAG: tRNA (adenosine(37)-N6)-threonylcarbamoyltransferase complex ATPase subunit type 1 TsaE [Nitrospirota bacterium]